MKIALTAKKSRELDRYMMDEMRIPGIILMENAAVGTVNEILKEFESGAVCVFCGTGNNGGDGFAVARGLFARGFDVSVVVMGDIDSISGDAADNFEFIKTLEGRLFNITDDESFGEAFETAESCDIIIDALFGTGLSREVTGIKRRVIEEINELGIYTVSIDIPSGVSADSGKILGAAVSADLTVTYQYPKIGHYLYPGCVNTGELRVVAIGVDDNAYIFDGSEVCVYESGDEDLVIGARERNTNKGDYGRLLIFAGREGMAGAAVMCTKAALKTGAGLTTLATGIWSAGVAQTIVPEAMCVVLNEENGEYTADGVFDAINAATGKTAIAAGPGIGDTQSSEEIVLGLLNTHDCIKVFDADAIGIIARNLECLNGKTGEIILTPHPKEFSRLCGLSVKEIIADPIKAVRDFIDEYDVTLLLKGAVTVIGSRDEGISLVCADVPGMAKGGSGDVLTGITAALAAQLNDSYMAALFGASIAAQAGREAQQEKGEYSMTPMDTIEHIGGVIQSMTGEREEGCSCGGDDCECDDEEQEAYLEEDGADGSDGESDIDIYGDYDDSGEEEYTDEEEILTEENDSAENEQPQRRIKLFGEREKPRSTADDGGVRLIPLKDKDYVPGPKRKITPKNDRE